MRSFATRLQPRITRGFCFQKAIWYNTSMSLTFDGRALSNEILHDLHKQVSELQVQPKMAVLLVGDNPGSLSYIRQKQKLAAAIGAVVEVTQLPETIQQDELIAYIQKFNLDPSVHGIIVQQPLPTHIKPDDVVKEILPIKDIDGFHTNSLYDVPVASAVFEILRSYYHTQNRGSLNFMPWLQSQRVVLLGKGPTGGKPIAKMLKKHGIAFFLIDSKTENREELITNATLIITAVGKPHAVDARLFRKESIAIGVGISKSADGKLLGDFDEEIARRVTAMYTPTPGGVGPVNVAELLKNLVTAANSAQTHS